MIDVIFFLFLASYEIIRLSVWRVDFILLSGMLYTSHTLYLHNKNMYDGHKSYEWKQIFIL